VVFAAGGRADSIARMTVYVTDKQEYLSRAKEVGAAWRQRMGKHFPAMALVEVKSLLDDRAKVEIEATALV
jgi:enamine deaminase RidA (YjgF/YER057c/UK114 family)